MKHLSSKFLACILYWVWLCIIQDYVYCKTFDNYKEIKTLLVKLSNILCLPNQRNLCFDNDDILFNYISFVYFFLYKRYEIMCCKYPKLVKICRFINKFYEKSILEQILSVCTPTNGMVKPIKIDSPTSLGPSCVEIWPRARRDRLFLEIALVLKVNIDENSWNFVILFYSSNCNTKKRVGLFWRHEGTCSTLIYIYILFFSHSI